MFLCVKSTFNPNEVEEEEDESNSEDDEEESVESEEASEEEDYENDLVNVINNGLAKNLRSDLYKKIQSFSFGNIDKFHASSLITRLTTDIQNVQQSFQMSIRIVFRAPMVLIFAAVMAFITGGNVAWIFVILLD